MKALPKALPLAAALVAALFSHASFATCYVVYGSDQEIVYRAIVPPVDMSRHLHETLPLVAPGGTLVFSSDTTECEVTINKLPVMASQTGTSAAKLPRTDRR
jgi:hypothetical protein